MDIPGLKAAFDYDPDTGIVRRKVSVPRAPAGSVVGTNNSAGRLICRFRFSILYVHRIAWALYYDEEPPEIIDHINRNPHDNRIVNLRAATVGLNRFNSKPSKNSKSGVRGVHWSSREKKWKSSIRRNGTDHHLGWFKSKDDAAKAWQEAAQKLFGGYA